MTFNRENICVGITGINSCENPAPGVGVAKSLRSSFAYPHRIIGLAYDGMESGVFLNNFFDKICLMPYPSSDPKHTLARLSYIKNKFDLNVIIPNLDSELLFYARYHQQLKELGIYLFSPTETQLELCNKIKLENLSKIVDTKIPNQEIIFSYDQLHSAIKKIPPPLVIKGNSYCCYKTTSLQEVTIYLNKIIYNYGYPVIIQDEIVGDEINIIGIGNGEGKILGSACVRKITTTGIGKIWTGVSIHNTKLDNIARKFVEYTNWRGPFEIECIASGEQIYLIEVNPRFPSWIYFSTQLGLNLPEIIVCNALGYNAKNEPISYVAGKLFIRHIEESIYNISDLDDIFTQGELSLYSENKEA